MTTDWKTIEQKYYMFCVRRQPIVIVRGEGTKVWDDVGKEYLDFTSGWAVNNIGHSNPVIADAISQQARTLVQMSNQFYSIPQLELAEVLVENSCLDKVFFCNSGAEANEGAFKLARKYGKLHRNGAFEIITANNSFHGRTLTTWSATGKPHDDDPFLPLPSGFIHVEYDDIDAIKKATTDRTVAVMVEPVQGEGGVNVPSEEYLNALRQWCDQNGLLLIFDEVQTGLGRLGALFGYEVSGVEPDIITLAKGLGGGVPIGAFLAKDRAAVFEPKGEHGSTFGGNPLTCAAANASTRYIIDHAIHTNAREMGAYLKDGLDRISKDHNFVTDVRGVGLLLAVEFKDDISADVLAECNQRGLLLNAPSPNTIRIMPPLTINVEEIDTGLDRLESGIVEAARETA
jgi:predicted acetylornithine/succinylornithine family transaminase